MRTVTRLADVSRNTVASLLRSVGAACRQYQDEVLRDLPCNRLQCDEVWAFCYAKERNVQEEKRGQLGYGEVWTWTALCADTKLIASWHVGRRNAADAQVFMRDLAGRLTNRVQLTTDGHRVYLEAVENASGSEVDYAMLIKLYGGSEEGERRYSRAECTGAEKRPISGHPQDKHIFTSYVERQSLSMRMGMRRFSHLRSAFSKKLENLEYAISLHFMYYNFARIHQSLRITPAMKADITDHGWEIEEIVKLADSN